MYYKPDWEKSKERMLALWNCELVDRCCVSVAAPKDGEGNVSVFAQGACNKEDPADVLDYWMNPQRILKRNIDRIENTYFGGESLPLVMPNFGTSGHAAYYGAKYLFTPETIWFNPTIEDLNHCELTFQSDSQFYQKQQEIVTYLAREGSGKFFVSMPDNCGTLDSIGHLHGEAETLIDLYDCPEAIELAVKTINQGWKKAAETFFNIIKDCDDNGACVGWMDTWAPGRHAQMQCDMSVMFSPNTYREIVLPELEEQMEWLEYPVYHFDGKEQINHLDHLLSLKKLKMIQWTNVDGQESPAHFIPALKRMQDAGKIINVFTPSSDIPQLMEELSSKGLYLHTSARDEQEAKAIIDYVAKHTHE